MMMLVSLLRPLEVVRDDGRGRRVSAIMDVMCGEDRQWVSTAEPMRPVLPVRMIFIVVVVAMVRDGLEV
jgi:phytoene/squalene synthetase